MVFDDGTVQAVTFPEEPPEANRTRVTVNAEIHEDGSLTGWYDELNEGNLQYGLRGALSRDFSDKDLQRVADAVAGRVVEGAVGDSLQIFDGRDLNAEPRLRVRVKAERAAKRSGTRYVLSVPLSTLGSPTLLAALERERGTRRYPIDVAAVVGPMTNATHIDLTLPDGWTAELPPDVHAESRFGTYTSTYAQEGRHVRLERTVTGHEGTAPKEALGELISWLKTVGSDDVTFLLLNPGS
jgi:hypothetical protein